jgi:cyclic-di-GMP phosphodiesterase TipF (flagellum assembly factor)
MEQGTSIDANIKPMIALRHILLIGCYAALAGGVALYLPQWRPDVGESLAFMAAGLVFLACALLHETSGRLGFEARLLRRLMDVLGDSHEIREDLTWTQKEIQVVRQTLEAVADAGPGAGAGRSLEDVVAEVKVLKSLVKRLSVTPDAQPKKPAEKLAGETAPAARPGADEALVGATARGPVADLDEATVLNVVRQALRDDRVDLMLQPIVSLPQRKRRYYECYSRLSIAEGTVIVPEQYIALAEREGLITTIDNMLLFRCIQVVRKIQRMNQDAGFFCNVSANTLGDEDFFGDFVEYLEGNAELAPNLVFEFQQADFLHHGPDAAHLLERLARLGCRCSVDQVSDLDMNVDLLAHLQVKFVKIDAETLLTDDAEKRRRLMALKRRLDKAGIDMIAHKIETEEAVLDLLDYEIDFGQGYLLGEPRLARPAG